MDLTTIKDSLPFATLTSAMAWQILGPSAKYLGVKGGEYTKSCIENIERILKDAWTKIPQEQRESGEVPPRVLRAIINEGAFTEDEIAASYLGGVLASSKVDSPRDDRGVVINSLISRLSVFQLRLHYVLYSATHYALQGTDTIVGGEPSQLNKMHFGIDGLLLAMGFFGRETNDPKFNIDSAISHALFGLHKESLIDDWRLDWTDGLKWFPSPIGVELFLWANGCGTKHLEFFFDGDFEPSQTDAEVSILPGTEYRFEAEDGRTTILHGFDYSIRSSSSRLCRIDRGDAATKND